VRGLARPSEVQLVVPGKEIAQLGGALAGVVFILIPLVTYLCIKVGVKPTSAWLTAGLWPRRRHRQDNPDAGKDLAEEAGISAAGVAQEWRVTIALPGAPGADRFHQWRRDVARELRDRLDGAVVEDRESPLLVYVDSQEAAEAAAQIGREVAAQRGLSADVTAECWHPLEEQWDAAAISQHDFAEEERISHEHQQQQERRRSAETGIAQWQVRAELGTHHDTVALAQRLSAEEHHITQGRKFLVAGADSEDDAHRLADKIRMYTTADAKIHVGPNTPVNPPIFGPGGI
jgi:hypothetical protein